MGEILIFIFLAGNGLINMILIIYIIKAIDNMKSHLDKNDQSIAEVFGEIWKLRTASENLLALLNDGFQLKFKNTNYIGPKKRGRPKKES